MPLIADEMIPLRSRGPQAPAPEKPGSSFAGALQAQFLDSWYSNAYRFMTNQVDTTVDPSYSPFEDLKGTRHELDPMPFAYSRNHDETMRMMQQADERDARRDVLARSGWSGLGAGLAVGLIDPLNFIPLVRVARVGMAGASAVRTGVDVALTAGLSTAAGEAVNYATDPFWSAREAAANVGTATVLGGILGAGASALLDPAERASAIAKLEQDRVAWGEDLSPSAPAAQSAGAAASDTRNIELVKTPLDYLPGGDPFGRLAPTRRLLNQPFQAARRALVDLAETPYLFKGNDQGIAVTSGPALDREAKLLTRQARVGYSDALEDAFFRYRLGTQDANIFQRAGTALNDLRGATEGKLTRSEFSSAIDDALRNGDQHPVPEVAEAATYVRNNVLKPWRDRAIAAGLLPEGVEPATADSYMMRSWNKQALTANRPAAVDRFTDWLESEQTRKAGIKDNLTGLARDLDAAEKQIEELVASSKAGSDAHVATLARVDELRGQIEDQLKQWKGKSANEALSAIKARDKEPRADGKSRLTAADKPVSKAMRRIIESDRSQSRDELRSRASEIVDRILGNPDGRLPYDDASTPFTAAPSDGARGPLAHRDFMIPDNMVREWLDTNVDNTLARFLNTIVPDVLLTERFGDIDMTEVFRKLRDEHAAMSEAATSEKARLKLKEQYDAAVADLAAVRDRIRGTYGNTTDPRMRFWGRMAANVGRYNQLTDMGGVTLTSLPDLAGPIIQYGFTGALRAQAAPLMKLLGSKEMRELAKQSKAELRAIGLGVETVMQARNASFADIFDMYQPVSRLERGLEKASNGFFIANLLSPWTDAMQRIAGTAAMDQFSRAVEAAAAGRAKPRQLRKLAEAGIDSTMAGRIWEQMSAPEGSNVVGAVRLTNSGTWTDQGARMAWEGAIARDVDMMVISPGQEKSLLPSRNPAVALLLQYKTFVMAATERMLFRGMQARDIQLVQGITAAVALGMIGEYAYSIAAGREPPATTGDWVKGGISRSGILGWLEEGNAVLSKWTGGTTDMYQAIGAEAQGSRYQSREKLGILLGPTANKLEGVIKAGGNVVNGKWDDADTRRMRRLLAGQNLFYIRRALDELGQE